MIAFVDSNNKTKHSQNRSPERKICQKQNYQREGSLALAHTIRFSDPTITQIQNQSDSESRSVSIVLKFY